MDCVDFSSNDLSVGGVEELVNFLCAWRRPVRRLKLSGNRIESLRPICRLIEDAQCGLMATDGLREIDISQNSFLPGELDELLNSVSRTLGEEGRRRAPLWPPLWINAEGNGLEVEAPYAIAEAERHLRVMLASSPQDKDRQSGKDVHLYAGLVTPIDAPRM